MGTREENVNNCRDANEDHNMGFDDIGCDQQYRNQIGQPIPEDDSVCWEIERFGFTEDAAPFPAPVVAPSEDEEDEGECADSPFRMKIGRNKRPCDWVGTGRRKERRCAKNGVESHCPATCGE